MDNIINEYVISFFEKKLLLHGDRPEAVGWSKSGQILRFRTILDVGNINNSRVLDFGCGKGDFYGFLKEQGIEVKYTGFDINRKLIGLAKEKYPEADFRVFDIDREALDKDFDYIFLCGVFNLKLEGIDDIIRTTLKKLFEHCTTALVFNALSSRDPKKDFELHYISPEEILRFATENLSPHSILKDDQIPHDVTMFIYTTAP